MSDKVEIPIRFEEDDFISEDDEGRALWNKGIYFINGEILNHSLTAIQTDILTKHLSNDWQDIIQLYINSPGGAMSAGWAFIDLLHSCKMKVRTIGQGDTSSLGAMLLASGTRGMRYCMPNTEIMIHQFSTGTQGSYDDLVADAIGNRHEFARHLRFWKMHSKYKTDKLVLKYLVKSVDNYLTPEDAVKHGIIDHILKIRKR